MSFDEQDDEKFMRRFFTQYAIDNKDALETKKSGNADDKDKEQKMDKEPKEKSGNVDEKDDEQKMDREPKEKSSNAD